MNEQKLKTVKELCEQLIADIENYNMSKIIEIANHGEFASYMPKEKGIIRARSLLLTRALADLRRYE